MLVKIAYFHCWVLRLIVLKICDFDRQFSSFSNLFYFAQNDTKNVWFNSWDPDLYDHAKITFIQPVIIKRTMTCQSWPGFNTFFVTACIRNNSYHYILYYKLVFTINCRHLNWHLVNACLLTKKFYTHGNQHLTWSECLNKAFYLFHLFVMFIN